MARMVRKESALGLRSEWSFMASTFAPTTENIGSGLTLVRVVYESESERKVFLTMME